MISPQAHEGRSHQRFRKGKTSVEGLPSELSSYLPLCAVRFSHSRLSLKGSCKITSAPNDVRGSKLSVHRKILSCTQWHSKFYRSVGKSLSASVSVLLGDPEWDKQYRLIADPAPDKCFMLPPPGKHRHYRRYIISYDQQLPVNICLS